jgi:hypothetical protein
MNHYPSQKNKDCSHSELRTIDDTYVFDVSSGLYKPKSYEGTDSSRENAKEILWKDPVPIKRDWFAIVISVVTLVFLILYTEHARVQADMARIAATENLVAANAARDSADTAKQVADNATTSFHISERPYVTVVSVEFDVPLEANKEIGLSVICDNSGHSPALKVVHITTAFMNGKRIGDPIGHEGASVIASAHPTKKHFLVNFSDTDVGLMRSNTDAFKVRGDIKYTDIFGEWHPTTYCATYDGKEKIFKFCPSGNDVR